MVSVLSRLCACFTICHLAHSLQQHAFTVNIYTYIFLHLMRQFTHICISLSIFHNVFPSHLLLTLHVSTISANYLISLWLHSAKVISKTHRKRRNKYRENQWNIRIIVSCYWWLFVNKIMSERRYWCNERSSPHPPLLYENRSTTRCFVDLMHEALFP